MITVWFFVFLYSLLAGVCLFLIGLWGHFAWERFRDSPGRTWAHDRYMLLSAALMLDATGSLMVYATRAITSCKHGLDGALHAGDGMWLAGGLLVILLSKALILWLVDLEAARPPRWTWLKWFAFITIVIGAAAAYATIQLPAAAAGRCSITWAKE